MTSEDSPTQELPPLPPDSPRQDTPLARKRSWRERHVRGWLLLSLGFLAVSIYFGVSRWWIWSTEKNLILHGAKVDAEIMGWIPGESAPKDKIVPPESMVALAYEFEGKKYEVFGALAGRTEQIFTRRKVPVYINPGRPTQWTAREKVASLTNEMIAAITIFPVSLLLFFVALMKRQSVLRIYRQGAPILAQVVGVGQTPIAPMSRMIRCVIHDDDDSDNDGRVIKTVLPSRIAPHSDQFIWLLALPQRPDGAIPADLFLKP